MCRASTSQQQRLLARRRRALLTIYRNLAASSTPANSATSPYTPKTTLRFPAPNALLPDIGVQNGTCPLENSMELIESRVVSLTHLRQSLRLLCLKQRPNFARFILKTIETEICESLSYALIELDKIPRLIFTLTPYSVTPEMTQTTLCRHVGITS